jgi:YafQ family addiction module toxin component
MFTTEFSKELTRKMAKIQKKNKVMFDAVINKIREIKENPEHYKPLRYDLKGCRRVHIMKSFVLVFKIDYANNKIIFVDFDHHDKIYLR